MVDGYRIPGDVPITMGTMSSLAVNATLVLLVAVIFGLLVYAHRHVGR